MLYIYQNYTIFTLLGVIIHLLLLFISMLLSKLTKKLKIIKRATNFLKALSTNMSINSCGCVV